jgi:alpha-ketoglutarate-dependent taurine dioxygenase
MGEKKSGSPLSISRLTPFLGAEVSGIDLSVATDSDTFNAIRDAFAEHQLLVFRNQTLTPEQQIAFSSNFGEVETFQPHPSIPDCRYQACPVHSSLKWLCLPICSSSVQFVPRICY